ncbi:MAG: 3-isopropylmalate dehydrogenase [Sphaerochaetaceae bacterium]|jgi:3-isopropylmalate dehydrogenase|nr:3-isopropylmalate dehydrogenase [Spirochaetaceae bacterium]MDY6344216.1 3-isopropylmalate dehydrogenase [Sphaerochaetaceae bacterium]
MNKRIVVVAGDGIGPDVCNEAIKVMERTAGKFGHRFTFEKHLFGGCSIDAYGVPLTDETLDACKRSDSVLLGAVGGPKWDGVEPSRRPEKGLLALRKGLGLFCNLRPAHIYPELKAASPLKDSIIADGLDIMIVRELTGGIYFGKRGSEGDYAFDTMEYHDGEIKRIVRKGFEIAMARGKRLCSVDKANVLATSRKWRGIVEETGKEFPEVQVSHLYVDNASMQLVRNPSQFDVIVTCNMFGDILSDEASQITGSIGMLPSASLGSGSLGMYEPIHGSAPDIAGKDIANPLATILSGAMMLRYSFGMAQEADAIEKAVATVLEKGYRTPDIMETGMQQVGTKEMGDLVAQEV